MYGTGEIVGHDGDLPRKAMEEAREHNAVALERLQSGAQWLMDALQKRDEQIDELQDQLHSVQAELASFSAREPTPGRPAHLRKVGSSQDSRDIPYQEQYQTAKQVAASDSATAARIRSTLSDVRTAPKRHAHANIACPYHEVTTEQSRADVTNSSLTCHNTGMPQWSYMSRGEYIRFARGVTSKLQLSSGDRVLHLAAADCGVSVLAMQNLSASWDSNHSHVFKMVCYRGACAFSRSPR